MKKFEEIPQRLLNGFRARKEKLHDVQALDLLNSYEAALDEIEKLKERLKG